MDKDQIEYLKKIYKTGNRVELEKMMGERLPSGLKGTVIDVDDIGQIHVKWDNGSMLALNYEEDIFFRVKQDEINVVYIKPNEHPESIKVKNELEQFQKLVGGYIETMYLDVDTCLICNEEAKLIGLEGNRRVGNDIIAGSFLVVGVNDGDSFVSLTEEQQNNITEKFYEIESYTSQEVQDAICIRIIDF